MFGGWLPSIFGRGRATPVAAPTDEDSSDSSPRPVTATGKKSNSRDSKKSGSKKSGSSSSGTPVQEDLLVERWIAACLNSVMLPARQELSGVFAALPMLALFCVIWMAATEEVRKHMASVCGIDKHSYKAFAALLARIRPSLNANSLMIYRALTTPDQIQTIDPLFTTKLEKRFGRRTIIPADRDKQRDYIRTNTKRMISELAVPSSAGMLGFAAASVEEKWAAETRPHPDRPFALNRREKQLHGCFEMRGAMRMASDANIDSCLIPFRDSPLALAILRPTERGGIVNLRRELTGKELHTALKKLREQKAVVSRVLLPRVDLKTAEPSLLPKWRLSGVLAERVRLRRKGGERVCPQFREIAAGASIRIDERGVHAGEQHEETRRTRCSSASSASTSSSSTHSYYSAAIDTKIDPNFNLRLDSPFLFFVVFEETMTPLLAGTYAGSALITPYNHSASMSKSSSKSSSKRSLARKSMDVFSRPLKRVRAKSSTKSSANSSEEGEKVVEEEEKEYKGVPKCEACEERASKSSKSKTKSERKSARDQRSIAAPTPTAPASALAMTPATATVSAAPTVTPARDTVTANSQHTSVRETLKETTRSTREGVRSTISAGRSTTLAAKHGIVHAAKLSGDKIGKGLDATKQTAVRVAAKSTDKLSKAKSVVSSTAKSIGGAISRSRTISALSRSCSSSRSVENDDDTRGTTERSERPARVPDKSAVSESSSRKATTSSARPSSSKSPSVTRSKSSESAAPKSKPGPATKPLPPPIKATVAQPPTRSTASKAKATGKEVARNVKKGLSKAKGTMKKLFGRGHKSPKPDENNNE